MEEQIFAEWIAMIGSKKRHPACPEIEAIAEFWTSVVTGQGQDEIVVHLHKEETKEQKSIRRHVTNTKTRYVTEKVKTTYREVDRCDSVKESIKHKDEKALKHITHNANNFYGADSIDVFNDTYLLQYSAMDPNGFQLTNIKPHDPLQTKPMAFPTIIKSKSLRNWDYKFNELQHLSYWTGKGKTRVEFLWTANYAYQVTPLSKGMPEKGETMIMEIADLPQIELYIWDNRGGGDTDETKKMLLNVPADDKTSKTAMYVTRYVHDLGFVPAKRLGWVKSFEHKHDVLESFLLPAKERYVELIQKKSQYDVHLAIHGIAKEITYLPTCNYVNAEQVHCLSGKVGGKDCPKCKGSSMMPVHTSPLDVVTIELPMTAQDGVVEVVDATKLSQFLEIPKHIIEMHEKAQDQAAQDVALALFNTNVFKRAELTAATATEVLQNNKSVDNALYAYGSHRGSFKEFQLKCIAAYSDAAESFEVSIKYPADYKLETEDELYTRRSIALKAGVSPQILKCIDMAILSKQNADNPEQVAYVTAVDSLRPFSNQTEAERIALFSSLPPTHPKRYALLYFDDVIYQLDSDKRTTGEWFQRKPVLRKELFDTTLKAIIKKYEPEEVDPEAGKFTEVKKVEEEDEDDLDF